MELVNLLIEVLKEYGAIGLFCGFLVWRLWLADVRMEKKDEKYDALSNRYIDDITKANSDAADATRIFDRIIGKLTN